VEFIHDVLAVGLGIVEGCKDIDGFVLLAFQEEPSGALGEFKDE
jgi:hypothetical protein